MRFIYTAATDIGNTKNVNQDAAIVMEAKTAFGPVLMGAVCDGMGGLSYGEKASSFLVKHLEKWFAEEMPCLFDEDAKSLRIKALRQSINDAVQEAGDTIMDFGDDRDASCGTTLALLILSGGTYFICNIGDSRVYVFNEGKVKQLTEDQTYINREIKAGRMTEEEAIHHPKRNVILQCVGASDYIDPEFIEGGYADGDMFMICSDGFRHKIRDDEFEDMFENLRGEDEAGMKKAVEEMIELNKKRAERDNITCILIRTEA